MFQRPRISEQYICELLSIMLVVTVIVILSGLPSLFFATTEYVIPIALALVFLLGFQLYPSGPHNKIFYRIVDWFLSILGFLVGIYGVFAVDIARTLPRVGLRMPLYEILFGVIIMALLLELVRRSFGYTFTLLLAAFIIYLFVGPYIPVEWTHKHIDLEYFFHFFYLGSIYYGAAEGVFGRLAVLAVTVIAGFLIFGAIMEGTKISDFLIDLFKSLTGHMIGGVGKATIWASILFGTITGSAAAEAAAIGSVTIPALIRSGFPPSIVAGIEGAAGTGGDLVPPIMGAGTFIMAEALGRRYIEVAIAATIPSLLFMFALYMSIHYFAMKHKIGGLPRRELPKFSKVMKEGGHLLLPIVFLIVFLFYLPSLSLAAFLSIIIALLIPNIAKATRVDYRTVLEKLIESAKTIIMISIIIVACDIANAVLVQTGLGLTITRTLTVLVKENPLAGLGLAAAGDWVIGLILPTTACYILSAALFAPPLISGGFDPLATHLFLYYFAMMAPLTPPVAIPVFVACSIAERAGYKTDFWKAMWYGTAFGALGYIIPFVFMFDPSLLILGSNPGLQLGYEPSQILLRTFFAGFATLILVAAVFGFYVRPLNMIERGIMGVTSILLYYPDLTYTINVVGCFIALIAYAYLKLTVKKKEAIVER